jgi:hypothetical protein
MNGMRTASRQLSRWFGGVDAQRLLNGIQAEISHDRAAMLFGVNEDRPSAFLLMDNLSFSVKRNVTAATVFVRVANC